MKYRMLCKICLGRHYANEDHVWDPSLSSEPARSFVRGAPQMDAPSEASSSMAPRFDRTAYQREYMREWRARRKAARELTGER